MFRHHVTSALRNIARNKGFALLNVCGLTIALAAALLIALFVRDELSYDRFFTNAHEIYRLEMSIHLPGSAPVHGAVADGRAIGWLKLASDKVIAGARIESQERGVRQGSVEGLETIFWADPDVFRVFPLSSIAGDLSSALHEADTVVLTRAMARKYFGRDDVVGGMIELDRAHLLRVTAVVEDLPSRTHLKFGIVASSLSAASFLRPPTGPAPALTYLRMPPETAHVLQNGMDTLVDRYMTMERRPPGGAMHEFISLTLHPIADVHLRPAGFGGGALKPPANPAMLNALSLTGALILALAAINFANLMTARSSGRAVEVGIRKTVGASRMDLIVQFMGESLGIVIFSLICATLIVIAVLPAFNGFLDREIALEPLRDFSLPAVLLGFTCLVALLGGIYPAFVLSAFRSVEVLKGGPVAAHDTGPARRVLVITQVAILIGVILAASVVNRQTAFAVAQGVRLQTDPILFIATPCLDSVKDRIAVIPGVRALACVTGGIIGRSGGIRWANVLANGRSVSGETIGVEAGLLELYGLTPAAGSFFRSEPKSPPGSIVINETAVRTFGFDSPLAAVGSTIPYASGQLAGPIIGVAPDFPIQPVQTAVLPTIFDLGRTTNYLAVKIDGARLGEVVGAIDQAWRGIDPARPINRVFLDQRVQELYADLTRQTQAFTGFVFVAVLLACLGLFGLSAFTAELRTKEIGIRKALGASTSEILRMLLWQFAKPLVWAMFIAWPVAGYAMQQWLEGFAYHIDLRPWMFLGAGATALAVALLTVAGHALLVARARPVTALRYE